VERPGSSAAEAYRVLRNSLDFVNFEHNIKTLLVTSSAPEEGKSTVSANLAAGLAQAGSKVVLLNCDFRRPVTQQFFEVEDMVGLSDVLTDSSPLAAALQQSAHENLFVLTSGSMPPNPSELLGSQKMSQLIESLKEWADWIIVDSPPLLAVADAATVARWADGVLLVTRGGVSTRQAAQRGRDMLDKVGARVVGVVVWGPEKASGKRGYGYYYDGYYGYGGSYYYSDYYNRGVEGMEDDQGHGKKRITPDSGAQGTEVTSAASGESRSRRHRSSRSFGKRAAELMPRILTGVLAFLVVLAVVAGVLWQFDRELLLGLARAIPGVGR
jgi:capsular exopolysaccharide synthesis family protein